MIDWHSSKNEIFFNPRMPDSAKEEMLSGSACLDQLKGHLCFSTSGTSGKLKWTALSKLGILASAMAVNSHIEGHSCDIWFNPLPDFHVGGIGIIARAYLSGAKVVPCRFESAKWDSRQFMCQLCKSRATLTSLVPAQVFDLVSAGFVAPFSLRGVIVGGGALSEHVYFSALRLGWKLLPSYGLTECSSQVATAPYGSWNLLSYPLLKPLSHVELKVNEEGFLQIKSEALLTGYIEKDSDKSFQFRDPKEDGWFTAEDKAVFEGSRIKSIHRDYHFIKIGGESVDLLRLEKILEGEKLRVKFQDDAVLIALEDERLGFRIHLVATRQTKQLDELVENFHGKVFPFERVAKIHIVAKIPYSPLNKVLIADLKRILSNNNHVRDTY